MKDNGEHDIGDQPRVVNATFPEWMKFAVSVVIGTIMGIGWAEIRFVTRAEWNTHQAQQTVDMMEVKEVQKSYAIAERGTSNGLQALTVDVAEIKNDVSWLRAYLDVSKPPPKKRPAQ